MSLILSGTDGLSDVDGSAATPAIRGTDTNTGIFFPAADTIAFAEGGAEVIRIDSSGRLGIGSTNPSEKLTIDTAGTSTTTSILLGARNSGGDSVRLVTTQNSDGTATFDSDAGSNGTAGFIFKNSGSEKARIDTSGNVGIGTSSPGARLQVLGVGATGQGAANTYTLMYESTSLGNGAGLWFGGMSTENTGVIGSTTSTGSIAFQTYNSGWGERARITYDGSLLVGKTSATTSSKLEVDASSNVAQFYHTGSSDTIGIYMRHGRGLSGFSGKMISFRRNDDTEVGSIVIGESSTSYNTSSDYRLKNSIAPMTGALAKVALLKPCTFKWNSSGSDGQGFIAHELAEVVPDCVTGEKDAVDAEGKIKPQGVDTSFLIATLTAAIQEQQALITQLTARITALEGT